MNETPLTDRQLQALRDLSKGLQDTATVLKRTLDTFEQAMAAREEMDTPDGWQLPKDWQPPTGRFGCWVEPAKEPWQIGDSVMLDGSNVTEDEARKLNEWGLANWNGEEFEEWEAVE